MFFRLWFFSQLFYRMPLRHGCLCRELCSFRNNFVCQTSTALATGSGFVVTRFFCHVLSLLGVRPLPSVERVYACSPPPFLSRGGNRVLWPPIDLRRKVRFDPRASAMLFRPTTHSGGKGSVAVVGKTSFKILTGRWSFCFRFRLYFGKVP